MNIHINNLNDIALQVSPVTKSMMLYCLLHATWSFEIEEEWIEDRCFSEEIDTRTIKLSGSDPELKAFVTNNRNAIFKSIRELVDLGFMIKAKQSTYVLNSGCVNNLEPFGDEVGVDDHGNFVH